MTAQMSAGAGLPESTEQTFPMALLAARGAASSGHCSGVSEDKGRHRSAKKAEAGLALRAALFLAAGALHLASGPGGPWA